MPIILITQYYVKLILRTKIYLSTKNFVASLFSVVALKRENSKLEFFPRFVNRDNHNNNQVETYRPQ